MECMGIKDKEKENEETRTYEAIPKTEDVVLALVLCLQKGFNGAMDNL